MLGNVNKINRLCISEDSLTSEEDLPNVVPVAREADKKRSGNARRSVNAATMSCYLC